jgi:Activator of Hsp90 ATPase homolog 1-like protein
MDKQLVVSKGVVIGMPRDTVWQVLTQPSFVRRYLYGAELSTDWTVGSSVLFRGEFDGQSWQDKGVVLACEPPSELRYSYWSGSCGLADRAENYATVSYNWRRPPAARCCRSGSKAMQTRSPA